MRHDPWMRKKVKGKTKTPSRAYQLALAKLVAVANLDDGSSECRAARAALDSISHPMEGAAYSLVSFPLAHPAFGAGHGPPSAGLGVLQAYPSGSAQGDIPRQLLNAQGAPARPETD